MISSPFSNNLPSIQTIKDPERHNIYSAEKKVLYFANYEMLRSFTASILAWLYFTSHSSK